NLTIARPDITEFADYQVVYINKVPDKNVLTFLHEQLDTSLSLLRSIDEAKGNYRYAAGKWTGKEDLRHTIDTERVFAYRALAFSRNDSSELPGFDQDTWSQNSNHGNVPLKDLVDEFECVRRSTLYLFNHLDATAWTRRGTANNRQIAVGPLA